MARIQVPSSNVYDSDHDVWVGYDSPMETFFGQVYDRTITDEDETDPIIFWPGGKPNEIKELSALEAALVPYCYFTDEIRTELRVDFQNRTTPTPLQMLGREIAGLSDRDS